MTELEPESLAFGTVFEYPEPLSENKFKGWLEQEGSYDTFDTSIGTLEMSPEGLELQNPLQEGIAEKDGISILYNSDADLRGMADSAFVTVKDGDGADFSRVKEETETLWNAFNDEFEVSDQIAFLELTLQARVRVDKESKLSNYFEESILDQLSSFGEGRGEGIAGRFESEIEPTESGWYRFTLNTNTRNPRIWEMELVQRYNSYEDIDGDEIEAAILETIDLTQTEGDQ